MSQCRNCHQRIVFVLNTKTGHRMPVDPFPDEDGSVFAMKRGGELVGWVQKKGLTRPAGWLTYMSHFATCPEHKPSRRRIPKTTAGAGQQGTEGTA